MRRSCRRRAIQQFWQTARACQPLLVSALIGALSLSPRLATANGRYPQAMQLAQDPSDSNRLWLLTTYGLLTSPNRGAAWYWICEEALGFSSSTVFDPTFAVHEDGTLIIGLLTGLRVSTSRGCDWRDAVEKIKGNFVLDVAVHTAAKRQSLVLVSYGESVDGAARVRYVNQIWKTTDNAKTFTLLAENLPANVFSSTLDAAPSNPSRLYLTGHVYDAGSGGTTPTFFRSNDEGKSWSRLHLPLPSGTGTFIAAVHPENADVIYVRSLDRGSDGKVKSTLLYSKDAGSRWRSVFTGAAPMMGFALNHDGSEVFVGLGDPGDRQTRTDAASVGLWKASTAHFKFQKVFDKSISCLLSTRDGLYACSRLVPGGFDLGLSTDSGRTFKSVQRRDAIVGPLQCPESTGFTALCSSHMWAELCSRTLACSVATAGYDAGVKPAARTPAGSDHSRGATRRPRAVHIAIAALVTGLGIAAWRWLRRRRKGS